MFYTYKNNLNHFKRGSSTNLFQQTQLQYTKRKRDMHSQCKIFYIINQSQPCIYLKHNLSFKKTNMTLSYPNFCPKCFT